MKLKWVWSGMTLVLESVSLWGLHSAAAPRENGVLPMIGCAALAAVILMGSYARANPRFHLHTGHVPRHPAKPYHLQHLLEVVSI